MLDVNVSPDDVRPVDQLTFRPVLDLASLDPPTGTYAWRGWRFQWQAKPGERVLQCRATDANGEVQPLTQRFDRAGFGNNAVHTVAVTVRGPR